MNILDTDLATPLDFAIAEDTQKSIDNIKLYKLGQWLKRDTPLDRRKAWATSPMAKHYHPTLTRDQIADGKKAVWYGVRKYLISIGEY